MKTAAERKAQERRRRLEQGLTRLEVYANPQDHQQIKDLAEKLRNRRTKLEKRHERQD